jgi:hypothetical protein
MYMNRNISRVLAAAVASAGFAAVPVPTFGASLSCAGGTFSVSPDGQGNFNVSCNTPGSSATCSITANPPSLTSAGGSVTLTASNCGTVSSWAKNAAQVATSGNTWSETIPQNTGTTSVPFTYTVQGTSGSDSVTVTESAPGTSTPPTGGTISCAGYSKTLVYDLPWTAQSNATTTGFGNDAIVVARFTTPATSVMSSTANVSSVEFGGPTAWRTASLSTVPCDLSGTGVGSVAVFKGNSQGPSVTYQILGAVTRLSGRVVLQPSTTYYFNIVNRNSLGAPSCGTSTCNMIIQLTKPTGL